MNDAGGMTPELARLLIKPQPEAVPDVLWCFDRGEEVLVYLDRPSKSASAWPRGVWEAAGFTLAGMRGLPNVPQGLRDQLRKGRAQP